MRLPALVLLLVCSLSFEALAQQPGVANQTAGGALRASQQSEFGASGSPSLSATGNGLDFGSYGRIGIGSDLRGNSGYAVNVASYGSRLEEPAYLELNFYYGGSIGDDPDRRWRVVVVPAFAGDLFHYTGDFSQHFALRNAYAETENVGLRGLRLWAGSRMYRGDDVYLFDFWPLDNLNTVGGGAGYRFNQDRTDLAIHIGMNRLDNLYQFQQVQVPSPTLPPGGTILTPSDAQISATVLDRQRVIASVKATQLLRRPSLLPGAKLVVYGEFHYLPSGVQQQQVAGQATQVSKQLPEDYGWVVGAQIGGWLRPFVFANVFIRASGGLGAYGDLGRPYGADVTGRPLSAPYGFDQNGQVIGARDLMLAFSANWESRLLGVMSGGYYHLFRDASPGDNTGYDEGALAVRPTLYLTRYLHVAAELSYQVKQPVTVDQDRGTYLLPQVFRASILPILAPLGRGTYSRPILYAVYTVSVLNDDAQHVLFDPTDVRAGNSVVHYLGLGAEWWFNSSYR